MIRRDVLNHRPGKEKRDFDDLLPFSQCGRKGWGIRAAKEGDTKSGYENQLIREM